MKGKKLTFEEAVMECLELGITLVEYNGTLKPCKLICPICGNEYTHYRFTKVIDRKHKGVCSNCLRNGFKNSFKSELTTKLDLKEKFRKGIERARYRAKERHLDNSIKTSQFLEMVDYFDGSALDDVPLEEIQVEHFIPLFLNMGGTVVGNVIPLSKELNMSKGRRNPFEWIKDCSLMVQHEFYNVLVPYLSKQNNMSNSEYKAYVYFCFDNPMTKEQAKENYELGISAKDMFLNQLNN